MADDVQRAIDDCRSYAERLARDHQALTAHMAGGPTSNGHGIADPAGNVEWTTVEAAALRRIASQVGRYQNLIEAARRALIAASSITANAVIADTTKAAAELRCDGYDDPTCQLTGVKDVWIGGHNHWLCVRCHDRYRQTKRREGVA